jgi:hypothetical protein
MFLFVRLRLLQLQPPLLPDSRSTSL